MTACGRLFQKVDQWMNKDEQQDSDARKKLEDANQVIPRIIRIGGWRELFLQENIQLKGLLAETQTNIAVLREGVIT